MNCHKNITLIGMPGSGKSTVGVLLAKELGYSFVDTDLILQAEQHSTLHELLETYGYQHVRQLEEKILLQLQTQETVIATGGSAVYSKMGMNYLKKKSIIIYLETTLLDLKQRLGDFSRRGIAAAPGSSLSSIYAERCPLYREAAQLSIRSVSPIANFVTLLKDELTPLMKTY